MWLKPLFRKPVWLPSDKTWRQIWNHLIWILQGSTFNSLSVTNRSVWSLHKWGRLSAHTNSSLSLSQDKSNNHHLLHSVAVEILKTELRIKKAYGRISLIYFMKYDRPYDKKNTVAIYISKKGNVIWMRAAINNTLEPIFLPLHINYIDSCVQNNICLTFLLECTIHK